MFEKVVVVTQRTRLEELLVRYNTRAQAKFYIEHMGLDFADYDQEHELYQTAVQTVLRGVEGLLPKLQRLDRRLVPTFSFLPQDLVVAVGRDGLVANLAKYVGPQPVVAVNPDPARWDGVLLPFAPERAASAVEAVIGGRAASREIVMAEAQLNDGQRLLAFNDFLIGRRTHVSARYRLTWGGRSEEQSSSGILVSTGVGATGWLSSAFNMAAAVTRLVAPSRQPEPPLRLGWEEERLVFVVREPFASRSSGAALAAGVIAVGENLRVESRMPEGGVIFSDGVEEDSVTFTSGTSVSVGVASQHARLVVS